MNTTSATREWVEDFWPKEGDANLQRLANAYAALALSCVLLAGLALAGLAVSGNPKLGQMAGIAFGAGLVLLAATSGMLHYYKSCRNVAGVTSVTMLWVFGEGVSRLLGAPMIVACVPAVLLGAMSMSYFTSKEGRRTFANGPRGHVKSGG